MLAVCNLAYITAKVSAVNLGCSVPYSDEIQGVVICPYIVVHSALELFGDIGLLAGLEVLHAESRAVALVAVPFHAHPGNLLSVRAVGRIGVIAHVKVFLVLVHSLVLEALVILYLWPDIAFRLAEINGLAAFYVIFVDV